jgi:hypothetical protein
MPKTAKKQGQYLDAHEKLISDVKNNTSDRLSILLSKVEPLKNKLKRNSKGGIKASVDKVKLVWSLVPWESMEKIVEVLMLGAKKYSASNWRKVNRTEYVDAAMRHLTAFQNGEAFDKDTGMTTHLAHLGCCVLFLIALYDEEAFDPKELEELFQTV